VPVEQEQGLGPQDLRVQCAGGVAAGAAPFLVHDRLGQREGLHAQRPPVLPVRPLGHGHQQITLDRPGVPGEAVVGAVGPGPSVDLGLEQDTGGRQVGVGHLRRDTWVERAVLGALDQRGGQFGPGGPGPVVTDTPV
jgi:hypothetical protein